MTAQMTPFAFNDQLVRTHMDENGDPWFVAKDVCAILGTETRDIPDILDYDEQKPLVGIIHTLNDNSGLRKDSRIISESGLYSLVFRSRKPDAKKFRKWVTSEVLPTLRKTGTYSAPPMKEASSSQKLKEETVTDEIRFLAGTFPSERNNFTRTALAIAEKLKLTDADAVYSLSLCLCKLFYTRENLTSVDDGSMLSPDTLLFLWKEICRCTEGYESHKNKLHALFVVANMVQTMKEKESQREALEQKVQQALVELAQHSGLNVKNISINIEQ